MTENYKIKTFFGRRKGKGMSKAKEDLIAIIRKVPPLINDQIMNKFINEQEILNSENA